MAELKEGLAVDFRVLSIEEERGVGGFDRRGDDGRDDGTGRPDGTVDGGGMPESREDYRATGGKSGGAGAGFRLTVVGFVGMDM